jgi:DNA-directed RNA polymerase subunit RPC12/RpoP
MGMYDTITDVPIKCPKCGKKDKFDVQTKDIVHPQLRQFKFGTDDWERIKDHGGIDLSRYRRLDGIASCEKCGLYFDVQLRVDEQGLIYKADTGLIEHTIKTMIADRCKDCGEKWKRRKP